MKRLLVSGLLLLAPAVVAPRVALAQSAAEAKPSAEAKRSFEQGKQLYEKGDLEAALPLLEKAATLTSSPNASLMVGRCLKDLGRRAEAYEVLRQTMRDATELANTDPKYKPTRDAAASLLAILEPQIARLIVVLPEALRGATVALDGRVLQPADLGRPIPVEPGSVVLVAEPAGQPKVERRVALAAGSSTTVVLESQAGPVGSSSKPGASSAAPPEPKPDEGPSSESGGGVRTAGFVIGAFGLAGLATFAVSGALVLDKQSTLDNDCAGPCPDASHAELIADGRTLQTVANVALGVGAGLLSVGVLMVAFGGPEDSPTQSARLLAGPGALRFVLPFD